MHDSRARANLSRPDSAAESIGDFDVTGASDFYQRRLQTLFHDQPLPPYAPLAQPGPLSILHLPRPGAEADDISDDIFVAGRFSNILHYNRRKFPSILGSIHSGARLCSMTSLAYSFSSVDAELRSKGLLSEDQVRAAKTVPGGRTIVACGEYNTKGSLELYGLRAPWLASTSAGGLQNAAQKNRQTSSQSKLLSVATHGTRLVFSDGSGSIKWFERDGFTEIRRCKIGHSERAQASSSSDDMARKLVPTRPGTNSGGGVNDNDLLFWTGERLGLIGFSSGPGFTADDFDETAKTAEELAREGKERKYLMGMRQALERQAVEARRLRKLGLGGDLAR